MNIIKKIDAFLINEQQNFPDSVVKNIVFHGTNKKFKRTNINTKRKTLIIHLYGFNKMKFSKNYFI